jgi:putative addiction module component (TIGR02574 family)
MEMPTTAGRNWTKRLTAEEIATEALALPRAGREQVAEALLASLRVDPVVEAGWTEEIRRRVRDVDSGRSKLIPGEDVLKEAEELLR